MAIGRISGAMLKSNLERLGTDLAFETDLLYLDVVNGRIGINTNAPTTSLQADNVTISGSEIRSTSGPLDLGADASDITIGGGTANYVLTTDGAGNLSWSSISDAGAGGGLTGMDIILSIPDDSSLYPTGAINDWAASTKVTNAIDDLNELAQNIVNNAAVINMDFTADVLEGGSPLTTTLTITAEGNPNRYTIDWGDGTTTTGTTDSTPTHTYTDYSGSPYDISVTAYNASGVGKGSSIDKTREDYIIVYTPDPVIGFTAYDALTGGSVVTSWDDGDTVYFENTTTHTDIAGADVQFTWSWGDSQSDTVVLSDSATGGSTGPRLAHTFDTATEEEQTFTVTLTLDDMSTCNPTAIPQTTSATYKIYDTHTPTFTTSNTSGINTPSGHTATVTNTTESTIGSYSNYGIRYQYQWGDGTSSNVNVGSGAPGDTGQSINHTYTLSSSDQTNGIAQDFTGNLRVISNHAGSPFISSTDFTVHVEPRVIASGDGTAVNLSDKSGDNKYDIYDATDYLGVNRALVTFTNNSQNATDYEIDWGDSSTNDVVTEDGVTPGSVGIPIGHDYNGAGAGNYTVSLSVEGTPDITTQTDSASITFQLNSIPGPPAGLSTKNITMSTSSVGTSPRLVSGFTDNSITSPLSAGDNLDTSLTKRMTSGTVTSSTVQDVYDGITGTLTAIVNGVDDGNKTFTSTTGETGTFTSLIVSQQVDVRDVNSSYPRYFYQVFDASLTKPLADLSVGVSDFRLEHSTTGDTNYINVLKDDMTSTPTFGSVGSLSAGTNGTFRYISGIPYYNTGSPTVNITGMTVNNLTGQAYTDQSNIVEVDSGTNYEGTSGAASDANDYSYSDIDGPSSMLTGGIPNANIGVSAPYALGSLSVPITSSSVRTLETIKARVRNVNGVSGYTEIATKLQVHTATPTGFNELVIPVADALGNGTYTDDGVRIFDFSAATTDTPSYTSSTNFYTNSLYTDTADPGVQGTQEATVRWGVLQHFTEDLSTGILPVGPDRSGDTGTQYYTFAFRRQVVANFTISITSSTGISGVWIAAPGEQTDNTSTLNGWLDCSTQYLGVGYPGADTSAGGNGSNGCAYTGSDVIPTGSSLSGGSYTMTLGPANLSNTTNNVALVRIALSSGETITSVSIGDAT